jgi:quercetin dioxygenase-like cupin family protein
MRVSLRAVTGEAAARETKYGLVHDEARWFVVSARDERWNDTGPFGLYCNFEGKKSFPQLGMNVSVLEPGQAIGACHRENAQEGFLVVAGECVAIVEGEEHRLRTWDYFHCPPRTAHAIVAAGDGPAVVIAVGRRGLPRKGIEYLEAARVPERSAERKRVRYGEGWLPDL